MYKTELRIGCHLSASKGFLNMAKEASFIGANTFQFFTRNPRGSKSKKIDIKDIEKFSEYCSLNDIKNIVAHAPYTMNTAAKDDDIFEFAAETMKKDLDIMELIPGNFYNFHPGNHVGQGTEIGIEKTSSLLNMVLKQKQKTKVLIETMAGKGSEIGKSFEEIRAIIDKVKLKSNVGVCLDTCHIYDAGYDIVNNLESVVSEFDKKIGLEKLFVIHLNDSKNPLGSHKDRHEKIGLGHIGLSAIKNLTRHPLLKKLTFILETPQENIDGYKNEIKTIKEVI